MAAGFYDIFRWVWGWKASKPGRGPFCVKAIKFHVPGMQSVHGYVAGEQSIKSHAPGTQATKAGC